MGLALEVPTYADHLVGEDWHPMVTVEQAAGVDLEEPCLLSCPRTVSVMPTQRSLSGSFALIY